MKIHGLAKMTLLDFPGKVACTVFLGKCDFRCPYCHNYELVDGSAPPIMDREDLMAFLSKRQGLLDGVATGALTYDEAFLVSDEFGIVPASDRRGSHGVRMAQGYQRLIERA